MRSALAHAPRRVALLGLLACTVSTLVSPAGLALPANPSAEQADASDPTTPAGWSANTWGDGQAVFSWPEGDAPDGSRHLRVSYVAGTEGDAKWWSAPIEDPAPGWWQVGCRLRTDVPAVLLLQRVDAATGAASYLTAAVAPVPGGPADQALWRYVAGAIELPAGTASLRVMLAIAQTGVLDSDDYILEPMTGPPTPPTWPTLQNPGAEEATSLDPTAPRAWTAQWWGDAAPTFAWTKPADLAAWDGDRALSVSLPASVTTGDARWQSDAVDVQAIAAAGGSVLVTVRYQSDVDTAVRLRMVRAGGLVQWPLVALAPPSPAGWAEVSGQVALPSNAQTIEVMQALDAQGFVTSDGWAIEAVDPPPQPEVWPSLQNGSVEEADAADPQAPRAWTASAWGGGDGAAAWTTGAAWDGERALRVDYAADASEAGEMVWRSDAVQTTGGWYRVRARYRSDVDTALQLRIKSLAGKDSWLTAAPLPASVPVSGDAWHLAEGWVELSEGTVQAEVQCGLTATGFVTFDAVELSKQPAGPPADKPLPALPNGSFEQADDAVPGHPAGWFAASWGQGEATPQWVEGSAFDGQRSVRLGWAADGEGDAKWWSAPVAVSGGWWRVSARFRGHGGPARLLLRTTDAIGGKAWKAAATLTPTQDGDGPLESSWGFAEGYVKLPGGTLHARVALVLAEDGLFGFDDVQLEKVQAPPAPPVEQTLRNPSAEDADPDAPLSPAFWTPETWGNGAATFTWQQGEALDGERTLRVDYEAGPLVDGDGDGELEAGGDARWRSAQVAAEPGTWLRVRSNYRADVETVLTAQLLDDAGQTVAWRTLAVAEPSEAQWRVAEGVLQVPAQATALRVMQRIDQTGWLQTDLYSLAPTPEPAPDPGSFGAPSQTLRNGGMEDAAPGDPDAVEGWQAVAWGDVQATATWVGPQTTGAESLVYEGQRSLRLEANYGATAGADGSAGWFSAPVVGRSGFARARMRVKGTVAADVFVEGLRSDGARIYRRVGRSQPRQRWQVIEGVVDLGDDVAQVRVFAVAAGSGIIALDNAELGFLADPSASTARPRVSLAIDGGWSTLANKDLDLAGTLAEHGFRATFFVHAERLSTPGKLEAYMDARGVRDLARGGHEIASFGLYSAHYDGAVSGGLSLDDQRAHLEQSRAALEALGLRVDGFAFPTAVVAGSAVELARERYAYVRLPDEGLHSVGVDPGALVAVRVGQKITEAELDAWVEFARRQGRWLIFAFPQISAPEVNADVFLPSRFRALIDRLALADAEIRPIGEVLDVWQIATVPPEPEDVPGSDPDGLTSDAGSPGRSRGCAAQPSRRDPRAPAAWLLLLCALLVGLGRSRRAGRGALSGVSGRGR